MHAYIITGPDSFQKQETAKLLASWGVGPFDVGYLTPAGEHIGITEVRLFRKQMLLAPLSSANKAGVIESAHVMTNEAQNALLKILEEPPPHTYIICQTNSTDALLSTIVSRCEIISGAAVQQTAANEDIGQILDTLLTGSVGKTLAAVDGIAVDRPAVKIFVTRATETVREYMIAAVTNSHHGKSRVYARILRNLAAAARELEVNVNPKLVLDTVFLPS